MARVEAMNFMSASAKNISSALKSGNVKSVKGSSDSFENLFTNGSKQVNNQRFPDEKKTSGGKQVSDESEQLLVSKTGFTGKEDGSGSDLSNQKIPKKTSAMESTGEPQEPVVSQVETVVENVVSEIRQIVKETLGIDDVQMDALLDSMGIAVTDLLNSDVLKSFVLQLNGSNDSMDLLLNESLLSSFQMVTDLLSDYSASNQDTVLALMDVLETPVALDALDDPDVFVSLLQRAVTLLDENAENVSEKLFSDSTDGLESAAASEIVEDLTAGDVSNQGAGVTKETAMTAAGTAESNVKAAGEDAGAHESATVHDTTDTVVVSHVQDGGQGNENQPQSFSQSDSFEKNPVESNVVGQEEVSDEPVIFRDSLEKVPAQEEVSLQGDVTVSGKDQTDDRTIVTEEPVVSTVTELDGETEVEASALEKLFADRSDLDDVRDFRSSDDVAVPLFAGNQDVVQGTLSEIAQANLNSSTRMLQAIDIIHQVSEQIRANVTESTTSLEMQLHPESLGKVLLTITAREGVMTATLRVQSEEARQALESQMYSLKETFEEKNLKVESVDVQISNFNFNESSEAERQLKENLEKKGKKRFVFDAEDEETEENVEIGAERVRRQIMRDTGGSIDFTA